MYGLDAQLTQMINLAAGHHPLLDPVMIMATAVGVPILVALVAVQWWRNDDRQMVRHALVSCGFAFLLGLGMNQLVLLFVHRLRPYEIGVTHLLVAPSTDWSLPSDHATATMAIAASFLLHRMPRTGALFLAASLVVMFSRVYVGIHFAGDVVAGAVTGVLAALLVWKLYRPGTGLDRLITGIL